MKSSEISAELARVLASADFVASEQLTQFLTFVVNESLEGRAEMLKERNIAVKALGREDDFDSRIDSIVRVVAGKLRRALERYYSLDGAANPLRIEMPKGSYQPVFRVPRVINASPANDAPGTHNRASVTRSLTRWRFSARGLGTTIFITAMCAITVWLTVVGTEVLAVRNRQFAPIPRMTVQAGALPFRIREGEVEVLVIRTRRDSHWTIAKSTRDGKTAMLETASAAAYQDAGVNGRAQPTLIGEYFYRRENRSYVVIVYPVLVNEQLSDWPESTRQRRWCSVETAADLVASDALGALIRDFQPS